MTGRLYIDIETCNVHGEHREVARPWMKIDSRLKDEDKIAAAREKALDQTALNGLWGEVIAIGYAAEDADAWAMQRKLVSSHNIFSEQDLLGQFAEDINYRCDQQWHKSSPCIIGHNVQFDIRFLWQRYVVNELTPPHWLTRALHAKPWDDEKVFDTMVQWCGLREYVSLGALCAGLGIEVPETIDGSEVPQAWLDGRYDEIRAHVLADVEAVRAVHRRMRVT